MIGKDTQDKRHIGEVVEILRKSFETKHADICRDYNSLREIISFYDTLLKDLAGRELQSGEEADNFLKEHIPFLLVRAPIVKTKAIGIMQELRRLFPNGSRKRLKLSGRQILELCPKEPMAKYSGDREMIFDMDDYLLLSRNFLAVYLGDPIKKEEYYRNPSKFSN